ncbi:hypothetical protein SCMU_11170 [Sinomonas cyclohexanicum]|uniref:Uncharacterized protein n=2 Tax=Sinomonas cyclohexanicum TaxID=322009 RepID=A0ABM7PSR2_SINCY|nr:hypothetical protein SCMU_11170 [Corynebacterium cyclohexanicum]
MVPGYRLEKRSSLEAQGPVGVAAADGRCRPRECRAKESGVLHMESEPLDDEQRALEREGALRGMLCCGNGLEPLVEIGGNPDVDGRGRWYRFGA